ncbi:hypothetical protein NLG97_g3394 [Lecanicillium saksenae]|uniref:Uncharacterized protein n=1 Tax=Lecanicillium saksenae TaxID=468837 RepID=A0ACC1R0X3_9HYPO|nr:hypothetical protein NLG97_g3394 [Lecanicillium saksenae]
MRYSLLITGLAASTTVYANVIARQDTDADEPTPTGVLNPFGDMSPECMSKLQDVAAAAPTEPPELQQYYASQGINVLTNLCGLKIPASLTAAESSWMKSMSSFQSKNSDIIKSCITMDPAMLSQMSIFGGALRTACSENGAAPTGSADSTGDAETGATPTAGGASKTAGSGAANTGSSGASAPSATGSGSSGSGGKGGDSKKNAAAAQNALPVAGLLVMGVAALL